MCTAFDGIEFAFNSTFGEPCVYTPLGGTPTNIRADYRPDGVIALLNGQDRVESIQRIAFVLSRDVPNRRHGDTLLLRGQTFPVREILDGDLNMTKLLLDEPVKVS